MGRQREIRMVLSMFVWRMGGILLLFMSLRCLGKFHGKGQ